MFDVLFTIFSFFSLILFRTDSAQVGGEAHPDVCVLKESEFRKILLSGSEYARYRNTNEYKGNQFAWTPFPASFWFVKTHKVGGATLAGIFRGISQHYGIIPISPLSGVHLKAERVFEVLKAHKNVLGYDHASISNHIPFQENVFQSLHEPRMLFGAVRNPIERFYSDLEFFEVKPCKSNISCWAKHEKELLEQAKQEKQYMMKYMGDGARNVEEIVEKYDFILVSDRMDESLVLFKFIYGLEYRDIAYISSHNSSRGEQHQSKYPKHFNDQIEKINSKDFKLFHLANKKLDDKIDMINKFCGEKSFSFAMQTFQRVQEEVRTHCMHLAFDDTENRFRGGGDGIGKNFRCVEAAAQRVHNRIGN